MIRFMCKSTPRPMTCRSSINAMWGRYCGWCYTICNSVMKLCDAVKRVEIMWTLGTSTMETISFASCCSTCWFIYSFNQCSFTHCKYARSIMMHYRTEGRPFTHIHCLMKVKVSLCGTTCVGSSSIIVQFGIDEFGRKKLFEYPSYHVEFELLLD